MKNYQKPLLTVETLVADASLAQLPDFDIIVSGDDQIYDDEA